tara:strand:+ start:337 stop:1035 length:699 start_codon:yes stop_codon:yes gene_type:complete
MKNILVLLSVLGLLVGTAKAAIVTPDVTSDLPVDVLFNFQVSDADEGVLPAGFMSQANPSISITSSSVGGTTVDGVAWLDDPFEGRPGGLGVCQTASCADNDDDNITVGESVLLTVSESVNVGNIYFRNGLHFNDASAFTPAEGAAQFGLKIDGVDFGTFALTAIFSALAGEIINDSIEFIYASTDGSGIAADGTRREFYVAGFGAPVPLPAALPMLLMGLLGLLGFRKINT